VQLTSYQLIAAGTTANPSSGPVVQELPRTAAYYTAVVVGTGTVTAGTVQLQGSADGTNWYNLGSAITAANGVVSALVSTPGPLNTCV
jgi:hypothetical protein